MPEKKRILIISDPLDLHARAVAYAIRAKGHVCEEFHCHDFPTLTAITLKVSNRNPRSGSVVRHVYGELNISEGDFDTIWLRRRHGPWLPTSIHAGDRDVAARQCDRVLGDFVSALDRDGVFWVNHFEKESSSVLKVCQLREARRAGLSVPETLVSNDPNEIRRFIKDCGGVAAHKLLQHASWKSDNGETVFVCYTSPVTLDDLPQDAMLRLCPAVFQPLLEKRFEVRVACFGDHLISLQIDSQSDERARIDWRANQWQVEMKPYDLPQEVAQGIRRFLRLMGLAYASLDFIVAPDGEHIFLEANPQGQFLWMEERTGLALLDAFSEFLIVGRREFHPERGDTFVSWSQFVKVWEGGLRDLAQRHVLVDESISVPEFV
jgi:glutathione synthase/RimK-type ligase-like ATP-grasp enzyme